MEEEKIQDQRVALMNAIFAESMKGYSLQPKLGKSRKFKFRDAMVDMRICKYCWKEYGRVFPAESAPSTSEIRRESHWFCRCHIEWMRSILAGTATVNGDSGADYVVKQTGYLPDNYIRKKEAVNKGWKPWEGNLWDVLSGACLYGPYRNVDDKLPSAFNRAWYEADINYHGGFRNSQRLLFSNDGLLFVSYDHYKTFFQIT